MLKKIFIGLLVFAGLIILVGTALFIWARGSAPKTDKEFLSQLKGEIVFTRRNDEGISDIWKVSANGTEEMLLYHNDSNPFKTDSRNPLWSANKEKIYFISFDKNKEKQIYEMDTDGKNVRLAENPDRIPSEVIQRSGEAGIKEIKGDLFIVENGQEKLIYDAKYDGKFNTGVSHASWNPDKKYLIFIDNRYTILIANTKGRITKLADGEAFDWKY